MQVKDSPCIGDSHLRNSAALSPPAPTSQPKDPGPEGPDDPYFIKY